MTDDTFRTPRPESPIKFIGEPPPMFKQAQVDARKERERVAKLKKMQQEKEEAPQDVVEASPPQQEHEESPRPQEREQSWATSAFQENPQPVFQNAPPSHGKPAGSNQLESLLKGIQSITTKYEEVKLPSKGRFYNGVDGPKDGILHVRPMLGQEEQVFTTSRYLKNGVAIDMIFENCIQEPYLPKQLLSQDRTYLLIFLRIISFGPNYDAEIKCPGCDKKSTMRINLNTLMVNYCPDNFQKPLIGTLPKTGYKFSYKLARGEDENLVTEFREKHYRQFKNDDDRPDDSLLYRTALMVNDIEGLSGKEELMILLKRLPIVDVSHIRNLTTNPPFGVDTQCELTCPRCLHDFEIDLPYELDFFFPRATPQQKETPQA